jgi:preprotein translocase SecE subunit
MARNRQRAKDRKSQQQHQHIHRENVSGELEHVGEVDEVEASIVAGADGEPTDVDEAELEREAIAETPAPAAAPARRGSAAPAGPRPEGNRVANFLRASWAELQRVQWPDRRQVAQATAVVLGFVAIAGAYLGLADVVAQRIVDFIL